MQLKEIERLFQDSLSGLYPEQEIYSLFIRSVEHNLLFNIIEIHQNYHKNIEDEAEKKILNALDRLKRGEPLQYILGQTQFYECSILVERSVLIPRPETEYLVDMIVRENSDNKELTILDLGTGSGCIAIAIASRFREARLIATDISQSALSLAKVNATKNNVQVGFIKDDLLNPKVAFPDFDIIISNPPYVRNQEKQHMHRNVLNFEPEIALFVSDKDPLIFYRAIADLAKKHLKPAGIIYLEINEYLGGETSQLFRSSGYRNVEIKKDMESKDRYLKVWQ